MRQCASDDFRYFILSQPSFYPNINRNKIDNNISMIENIVVNPINRILIRNTPQQGHPLPKINRIRFRFVPRAGIEENKFCYNKQQQFFHPMLNCDSLNFQVAFFRVDYSFERA